MKATVMTFAYGGVHGETAACLLGEQRNFPDLEFHFQYTDALIDRSRSKAASMFLHEKGSGDVFVMIDHDIIWRPGDLNHLVMSCAKTKSVVCGIYPKRGFGQGTAVRYAGAFDGKQGDDALVPITYGPSGFMAIHRDVLVEMSKNLTYLVDDMWPFFLPTIMPAGAETHEELSEDYAFCLRVLALEVPVYADLFPVLCHVGEVVFRMEDAKKDPRLPNKLTTYEFHKPGDPLTLKDGALFYPDPEDTFISAEIRRSGEWGPRVAAMMEKYLEPGMSFLDLGAHAGYFCQVAEKLGAKPITAVEPLERMRGLIEKNAPSVASIYTAAVWDKDTQVSLAKVEGNTGETHVVPLNGDEAIDAIRLDDLPHADVIKVDIEGAEYRVFKAAPLTMGAASAVIFEYCPSQIRRTSGVEGNDLLALFRSAGFVIRTSEGAVIDGTLDLDDGFYTDLVAVR